MARNPFLPRALQSILTRAAGEFPAVVLTGPRQSGKTTLLQHLYGRSHRYLSLELPDVRAAALADPRGFLALSPPPVIFDEIQYAPDLLPYIKESIDADRSRRGQYLITGSQNLLLAERVTESLAGRAAMLRLLPLAHREEIGQPSAPLFWERNAPNAPRPPLDLSALWASLLRGDYPELVAQPGRDVALWHASYIQTYLERDVRTLRQVGDLSLFQAFLRVLAARSGQLLNLSDMARDLGIAVNTAKAWLSVLEATYQVLVLRPYFANVGKRLVKTPKVYFTDTGTLCALVGLASPEHAAAGPMGGALFETAVIMEVFKALVHRGQDPQLYFWRTAAGQEVDLVVETGGKLIPIEIKLTATPHPGMVAGIAALREALGPKVGPGWLIHPGDTQLPLGAGVRSIPFAEL
ncbi:MAG: ATP-binding protein [Anaerolineales bacterium]|nr:ATP-binding protein [Anaerolineales bacterium]